MKRQKQTPIYQRLWDQVPADFKKQMHGFWWSTSVHAVILASLLSYSFTVEGNGPLTIELGFSSSPEVEQLLTLEPISEPIPLTEALVEEFTPVAIPEPTELLVTLPEVTTALAATATDVGDVTPASTTAAISAEVAGNDSRVVEVNRRVKAAGGKLDGPIRVSLMWGTNDDIDLHVNYISLGKPSPRTPFGDNGYLWYGQPASAHARLDVDANAMFIVPNPCENTIFRTVPKKANYAIALNLFAWRSGLQRVPYVLTVHHGKKSKLFEGTLTLADGMKQIHAFQYP